MNQKEKQFVKTVIDKYQLAKGTGLDVGCGPRNPIGNNEDARVYPEYFTGVDHDPKCEAEIQYNFVKEADKFMSNGWRMVLFSHMLEDCENPYEVLRQGYRILQDKGYMIIVSPYRHKYFRIGHPNCNPSHKYDFTPRDMVYIIDYATLGRFEIVEFIDDLSDRSFGLVIQKDTHNEEAKKRDGGRKFRDIFHDKFPI